jgi:uncharacterized membrane protein (DUF2068 family)
MSDVSRTKRWAAQIALALVGVGVAASGPNPFTLVAGASLVVAGVGIGRQNLLAHFLSRGVALLTFLLATIAVVAPMLDRQLPQLSSVGVFGGTSLALLLTRPLLRSREAQRAFAPARFRDAFLAGASVTSMTAATMIGIGTFAALWGEAATISGGLIALGIGHVIALVGLLRMKTWGLLAGVLNSAIALALAAGVDQHESGVAFALTALPGLLLIAPIALSRVIPPRIRVAVPAETDPTSLDAFHDPDEREARGQARVLGHDGRSHAV